MPMMKEGDLIWQPTAADLTLANLTKFHVWLREHRGYEGYGYQALWRWSVEKPAEFWVAIAEYCQIRFSQPWTTVLTDAEMPNQHWFVGAQLNYAENIFARRRDDRPMLYFKSEAETLRAYSWAEIEDQTRRLAQVLRDFGIRPGDRVVAYLPNIPEALVALLAVASLGAIWSSCSPDFGSASVLDRFRQIEPRLLIAVDGYQYGGKRFDRRQVIAELQAGLPSLEQTLVVQSRAQQKPSVDGSLTWSAALAAADPPAAMTFTAVPFEHPLWVVYSSGTTGLPKPIVHGHGGIVLEHTKSLMFHNDIGIDDRFFWYSSTGWMMWNYSLGSLLAGATPILYDGSPNYPDLNALFALAEEAAMTYFGTSAAFIGACLKAELRPNETFDLSRIRAVGSTGSPLTVEGFQWVYDSINPRLALESLSGGTDLCTAFVGGARSQPIYAGEIQGAALGANVQAFNEAGEAVINEVGELVIASPMPSMPLYFWNDPAQDRYRSSYFEKFPGVWRHGDWILFNERGGCIIYGRSDATINRQGIRTGTSEIYRVVEGFDEVVDSLIVDLEFRGRASFLPLFIVLRPDVALDDALKQAINARLRQEISPRHVPNEIIAVEAVPYTLSGKKMEVPIRKILLGLAVEDAANVGAMRNPESIPFFVDFGRRLNRRDGAG